MRAGTTSPGGSRPPAVAGAFYPRDPERLRDEVARLLADVPRNGRERPKALVVPHAGYVYSGPIAGTAYARLLTPGPRVARVVLLGPAHTVPVAGLALPDADAFVTPLGAVPVDRDGVARALALPQVTRSGLAHQREHSLEVQLPFLQAVLGPFSLVPLVVGHASAEDVAGVLRALWGGDETLVVVSTDLSHYLPYEDARDLDGRTAGQVLALDAEGLEADQACGAAPLRGLLLEARRRGLTVDLLDLRSSGDTAGDRERVVGYGAFALFEPRAPARRATPAADTAATRAGDGASSRHRAEVATALARAAIASLFGGRPPVPPPEEAWLADPGACFVSLHRHGELRGCIGTLEARAPLGEEIVRCARAAATEDFRFDPVEAHELPSLELEVSVLGPLEPLPAADEAEALSRLRPGVDGLLLDADGRRATFIPAMWEQLPDPRDFLSHLRRKAGLPDRWLPGTRLWRFTAERHVEAPR